MRRKLFGSLVVMVWLAVMGLLLQRYAGVDIARVWESATQAESNPAPGSPTKRPADAAPETLTPARHPDRNPVQDEWMVVSYKNQPAGYGHALREPLPGGDGWRITDDSVMQLTLQGSSRRIETHVTATTGPDYALQHFSFRLTGDNMVDMRVTGRVRGTTMFVRINPNDEGTAAEQTLDVPLGGPIFLDMTVVPRAAQRGLEVGRSFTIPIFDPSSMSTQQTVVRVESEDTLTWQGRPVHTFVLAQEFQGITVRSWVGEDGALYKSETPLGFVLTRSTRDEALAAADATGETADLLVAASIPLDAELDHPKRLTRLVLELRGVDLNGFALNDGERQSFDGARLIVTKGEEPQPAKFSTSTATLAPYLKSETFVESDNPAIKDLARKLKGDSTDAVAVARRLHRWVYDNIEKTPTVSIPSAVDVLRTKRGDCNEHTVLLTALARAAGIPARMHAGLVYLDGRFYYHAWTSLYLGGEWVPVDAALGQFPADVTHLSFIEGGLQNQAAILRLIGNLQISFEDAS